MKLPLFGGFSSRNPSSKTNSNSSPGGGVSFQFPIAYHGSTISDHRGGGSSIARTTATACMERAMLQSISAMPVYQHKSHEELRHEDYDMNNKGNMPFGMPSVPPLAKSLFALPESNPLGPQSHDFGFPTSKAAKNAHSMFDAQQDQQILQLQLQLQQLQEKQQQLQQELDLLASKFQLSLPWNRCTPPEVSPSTWSSSARTSSPRTTYLLGSHPRHVSSSKRSQQQGILCSISETNAPSDNSHHHGGSSIASYYSVIDKISEPAPVMFQSISAMPIYKDKSHEELRWEDYELNNKGDPSFSFPPSSCPSTINLSQPSQFSSSLLKATEVGGSQKDSGKESLLTHLMGLQPTQGSNSFFPQSSANISGVQAVQPNIIASIQHGISNFPVKDNSTQAPMMCGEVHSPIDDTYKKGEVSEEKGRASFHVDVKCISVDEAFTLLPKLGNEDYYTEPSMKELEAMERAEPGFCSHVKDFVVGRKHKGSIKFLGEVDIRQLDLKSIVQFNDREVTVYLDDRKKPPVGQGLNRPAEVTLLVKCIGDATGQEYVDGPQVQRFEQKLMEKAADIGAEVVSFDPISGEWKFRVQHF